jgi:hypothetical protein
MAVAASKAIAPDGGPYIEIEEVVRRDSSYLMRGTAIVWEGTLLLRFIGGQTRVATASVGGPERGSWNVSFSAADASNLVEITPSFDPETLPDRAADMTISLRGLLS